MDQYLNSSKLSPIEMAKHLINLKPLTKKREDFENVKNIIVPKESQERINQIIYGLEQEDEFAVLCKLMGTCDSISKIDQSPIINNNEVAPDFLASFSPGSMIKGKSKKDLGINYQCFVEVKSCRKNIYKISKKDLDRRISYAKRYRLPLVFAVRFTLFESHGLWAMFDSSRLIKQDRKIKVEDVFDGLQTILFDDYAVLTYEGMFIANYYKSSYDYKEGGIKHKKYGTLVKTAFISSNEEPIVVENKDLALVSFVMSFFEGEKKKVEKEGDITCEILYCGSQMKIISDLVFRANHIANDEDGGMLFDASKVISTLDSKENIVPLITRKMVEYVFFLLNSQKLMFHKIVLGSEKSLDGKIRSIKRV